MHTFLQTLLLTTVASADARYFSMKDKSVVRDEALRNKATPPAESAAPPQAAAVQEVSSPAAGAETPAATTAAPIDTAGKPTVTPNASDVGGLKQLGSVSGIPSNFVEDPKPDAWASKPEAEAYPFEGQKEGDDPMRVHVKVQKISGRTGKPEDFNKANAGNLVLGSKLKEDGEPLTLGDDLSTSGKKIEDSKIKEFIEKTKDGDAQIERALESQSSGNQNFGKGDIAFQEMVIDTRALATATDQIQKELGKHQEAITDVDTQFKAMQAAYKTAIGKVATGMKEVAGAEFAPEKYNDFTEAQYKPDGDPKSPYAWPKGAHANFPSYDPQPAPAP
jgi:hypothetical protein